MTTDPALLLEHVALTPTQVTIFDIAQQREDDALITDLLSTGTRVLVVGEQPTNELVAQVLLYGASDFLPLAVSSPQMLVEAVATVASGSAALNPLAAQALLAQWREMRAQRPQARQVILTDRERDILHGLGVGDAGKQLAKRLGISEKTVESHKSRLYSKLEVRTQAEAVAEGYRRGLMPPAS